MVGGLVGVDGLVADGGLTVGLVGAVGGLVADGGLVVVPSWAKIDPFTSLQPISL